MWLRSLGRVLLRILGRVRVVRYRMKRKDSPIGSTTAPWVIDHIHILATPIPAKSPCCLCFKRRDLKRVIDLSSFRTSREFLLASQMLEGKNFRQPLRSSVEFLLSRSCHVEPLAPQRV